MFSRQRRRRASPEPASSISSASCETQDIGPRRRRTDHNGAHATQSPAIVSPFRSGLAKKKPPSLLPTFQAGNTCNSFLLGGQYPTKENKRIRHGGRRTLWYRIFCSSPLRMVVSTLVVSYLLLWHVIVPATHALLDFGRIISAGKHGFTHVTLLNLPSLDLQRKEAVQLQEERDRLHRDRRHDERFNLLEQIVPNWYHVNYAKDPKARKAGDDESDDEAAHEQHARPDGAKRKRREHRGRSESSDGKVEKRGTRHVPPRSKAGDSADAKKKQQPAEKDSDKDPAQPAEKIVADDAKAKPAVPKSGGVKEQKDEKPLQRTLENMDSFPVQSSCPADLAQNDITTSLVIQSSLERLWILNETCQRWKSPIVAAVYIPHGTEDNHRSIVAAKKACPQLTVVPLEAVHDATEWAYPVNRLRNMALDTVQTSHILVADIDFVPSVKLDDTIHSTIVEQESLIGSSRQEAVVVPAFERLPPKPCTKENDCSSYLKSNSSFIPQALEDLRTCAAKKDCSVFQRSNNWEGHYSTRSESWLKGDWYEDENVVNTTKTTLKRIKTIKCFDSLRYEPYVVLRWCPATSSKNTQVRPVPIAPYYDERFYAYGKNKIQVISHLRFMGYHFSVLPKGFIVHNPHVDSAAKQTWNNVQERKIHQEMDALYYQFLEELWAKYKGTTDYVVQQCKRPKKKSFSAEKR